MAAQLADGSLYLNARSYRGNNRRLVARSDDGGDTWTPAKEDPALVEPVCQASVLYLDAENLLLFANPASKRRRGMTVKTSTDGGRTWDHAHVVHKGPAAYSDLVRISRDRIGLLYERGDDSPYERIAFQAIPLNELTGPSE